MGIGAPSSGDGRQYGQFSAVSQPPVQPPVLAGRREHVDRPILSDAHDLHPARGQRFRGRARPATTPSFRRCVRPARSTVMTDSDDYLVVEMQPRDHESEFLRLGAETHVRRSRDRLANGRRRVTATTPVQQLVFHAAEIPPSLPAVIEAGGRIHRRDRIFISTLCHRICTVTIRTGWAPLLRTGLRVSRKLARPVSCRRRSIASMDAR